MWTLLWLIILTLSILILMTKHKKAVIIFVLVFIFIPSLAFGLNFPAQPVSTPPTQGLPTDLGQLISQIFTWSLGILGISVFVMFFYSGFLWLTAAGNTSKIGEAKTHMTNAVFGAILLLSSYLILYTINPDFVRNTVNLPGLGKTNSPTTPGGGAFVSCDSPPNSISPNPMSVMQQVRSEFPNIDLTVEGPGLGTRDEFTAIVAWRLHQIDAKWGRKRAAGPQSTDTLGYLRPDIGPGRFEAVDLVQGGTTTLIRGCVGVVDSGQTWIQPSPAP